MNISPARSAAFDILLRIESERAFSSVLLPSYEAEMSRADRSLCHEITLGTLRRQIYLDRIIDTLAGGRKLDAEVRIALRLGLYQLTYLDRVPAYSAIDESVNLVKRAKKRSASGFANAILRRVERAMPALEYSDEVDRLSVETSHPRWLIEKWTGDHGTDKAAAIAHGNNELPRAAFRLIAPHDDNGRGLPATAAVSEFVENCYVSSRINPKLLEMAELGKIYFQDEASQMAAHAVTIPAGGRFLDVCAAPGGKTGLIARRYGSDASLVAAGDLYDQRVDMLRENCRCQGAAGVVVVQYDAARALPFADAAFDSVLVDAPCTGTGTIRHNPEIRYFLKPRDFEQLPLKQLSILTNASKLVKPGGSLVYSTCSLESEENEAVCEQFMASNDAFRQALPRMPERFLTDSGFARTWPERDGMDGFFAAAFERR